MALSTVPSPSHSGHVPICLAIHDHCTSDAYLRRLAIDDIDELNSTIGCLDMCKVHDITDDGGKTLFCIRDVVTGIQSTLIDLEAHVGPLKAPFKAVLMDCVEDAIDRMNSRTGIRKHRIIPRGMYYLARSVCCRSERSMTTLCVAGGVDTSCVKYVSRLVDFLTALARYHAWCCDITEIVYVNS